MQLKTDLAIVIRSVPFEERHRIITALTEQHGKVSALARNSIQSRRFGGTLELFVASQWTFSEKPGSELLQLKEAEIKKSFEGIRTDFQKLALGSVFSELVAKVAPQQEPCPDLFKLHANSLAVLDDPSFQNKEVLLLNAYLAKLLQWSGNQPRVHSCLECGTLLEDIPSEEELTCIITNAAWVCSNCRIKYTRHIRERISEHSPQNIEQSFIRLSPQVIGDFQMSLGMPIKKFLGQNLSSLNEHQKLFQFLEAMFIYHIPGFDRFPLKSLRFLGLESNLSHPAVN